ncbi:MAG: ribosome-associated heat shock protein Hsp15 [Cryomorphaceae bacterium]|jgi:ribosome-associated heat shock protein Hsp15
MNNQISRVRIDKWLWAARFFKTRQLAVKALKNTQVRLNSAAAKPAANLSAGDLLRIKKGLHEIEIEVLELSEKRGSASIAQALYLETSDSIANRKRLQEQLASQPKIEVDRRKPDKRALRDHRAFKRQD